MIRDVSVGQNMFSVSLSYDGKLDETQELHSAGTVHKS